MGGAAAEALEAQVFGLPGGAVEVFVVDTSIVAYAEDVEAVRGPCRGGDTEGRVEVAGELFEGGGGGLPARAVVVFVVEVGVRGDGEDVHALFAPGDGRRGGGEAAAESFEGGHGRAPLVAVPVFVGEVAGASFVAVDVHAVEAPGDGGEAGAAGSGAWACQYAWRAGGGFLRGGVEADIIQQYLGRDLQYGSHLCVVCLEGFRVISSIPRGRPTWTKSLSGQ